VVTPLVTAALPLPLSPGPVKGLLPVNPPVGETAQKVIVLPADTPELIPPSAIEDIFPEAPPAVVEESTLEDVGVTAAFPPRVLCSLVEALPLEVSFPLVGEPALEDIMITPLAVVCSPIPATPSPAHM